MQSRRKTMHIVLAAAILGLMISGFAVAGTVKTRSMSASSSIKVDSLHAKNSDQLAAQDADRYAAVGAKVHPDGVVATKPSSYGLDISKGGGDGVSRTAPGTYIVSLPDPSNEYLFQLTGNTGGVDRPCSVLAVSDTSGDATIICTNTDGNLTDASFYISATKP